MGKYTFNLEGPTGFNNFQLFNSLKIKHHVTYTIRWVDNEYLNISKQLWGTFKKIEHGQFLTMNTRPKHSGLNSGTQNSGLVRTCIVHNKKTIVQENNGRLSHKKPSILSLVSPMHEIQFPMKYTCGYTLPMFIPLSKPIGGKNSVSWFWFSPLWIRKSKLHWWGRQWGN